MPDQFDLEVRSKIMFKVHSSGTTFEIHVRSFLKEIGCTFSLKDQNLPEKPDLFLSDYNKTIFANGQFWPGYPICRQAEIIEIIR